jgi:hypothetical protein
MFSCTRKPYLNDSESSAWGVICYLFFVPCFSIISITTISVRCNAHFAESSRVSQAERAQDCRGYNDTHILHEEVCIIYHPYMDPKHIYDYYFCYTQHEL